jgi:ribose transport system permease protein
VIATLRTGAAASALARIPGVAVVLIVLILGFAVASDNFRQPANIANILVQSTILLLIALPMTLIIMTEGLDLSMGAVLTFASVVLAWVTLATGSASLGLAAAMAIGLGFGLANGALVAFLDIPPFIVTLGTLGVAQGLSLLVTDGQSIVGLPRSIQVV